MHNLHEVLINADSKNRITLLGYVQQSCIACEISLVLQTK